ncbi:transglutaminase domain-containing protein [Archangium sp.]|uniref:transglutaminase domain-containing protein n=1 Tax=Archangium sp. TaxID=1872627 RepID=UPI002D556BBA|nr:transglutaminase domain-containing protein [Archangium sp.]HYO52515.1 transglutaminase domain-containing protein [Archangium sp.]
MAAPPSSPWKTLRQLFLVLFTAASCCYLLGLRWLVTPGAHSVTPSPDTAPPPELSGARSTHLGLALVPSSTPPSQTRTYEWRAESLVPPEYRVGYGLGKSLARSLEREHLAYGRRMRFRPLGPARFTYQAPPECQEDMRCIYAELMRSNAVPVRALGTRFVEHIRAQRLDPLQAAELIITFVQRIHYVEPDNQPFGVLPPALVAARDEGDCDSKAVLAVMLLRQAGIDAAILYSDPLSHAAVGVGLPVRGPTFRLGGHGYRYAELTTEGWPLGMIPPQHDKPHLWKVLPLPEPPGEADSRVDEADTPDAASVE